jgi:hypothetical protein
VRPLNRSGASLSGAHRCQIAQRPALSGKSDPSSPAHSIPATTLAGARGSPRVRSELTVLDAWRYVGIISDVSLRAVKAEHYVEGPKGNREPVGERHASRRPRGHINRERAVWIILQPWRVTGYHVFVCMVVNQFDRLRGIRGEGPEALRLGELLRRKRQDIATQVAPIERAA